MRDLPRAPGPSCVLLQSDVRAHMRTPTQSLQRRRHLRLGIRADHRLGHRQPERRRPLCQKLRRKCQVRHLQHRMGLCVPDGTDLSMYVRAQTCVRARYPARHGSEPAPARTCSGAIAKRVLSASELGSRTICDARSAAATDTVAAARLRSSITSSATSPTLQPTRLIHNRRAKFLVRAVSDRSTALVAQAEAAAACAQPHLIQRGGADETAMGESTVSSARASASRRPRCAFPWTATATTA